jgi:hypothetical protein
MHPEPLLHIGEIRRHPLLNNGLRATAQIQSTQHMQDCDRLIIHVVMSHSG